MALDQFAIGSHRMKPISFEPLKMWAHSFIASFKVFAKPVCVRMFFLGFSAGLPLLLILGTLGFWLREAGVSLKTIGFMSWVGLIYAGKWVWAPLVDSLRIPFLSFALGQRRAWLALSQSLLIASLAAMSFCDPALHLNRLIFFAVLAAFSSATQDIALDSYRIESAPQEEQGALAAVYQTGYRLAMIWSGAGALALAAFFQPSAPGALTYSFDAWSLTYLIMAASVGVGLVTTLLSPPPNAADEKQKSQDLKDMDARIRLEAQRLCTRKPGLPLGAARVAARIKIMGVAPIVDFFERYGRHALLILLLIATYRISDVVMGVMSNPFYRDMGFTKDEVAAVSKVFGVLMSLAGTFVGGVIVMRRGIFKTLFLGALLSASTNLLFSVLAGIGHNLTFLIFTVCADNLSGGIASAAFIAYLSSLTNVRYSATQYAVFSSIMLILPKFLAGFSGVTVEAFGYGSFFTFTALLGIPVLILIPWAAKGILKDSAKSTSGNTPA